MEDAEEEGVNELRCASHEGSGDGLGVTFVAQ
jgi:hypothetical protein